MRELSSVEVYKWEANRKLGLLVRLVSHEATPESASLRAILLLSSMPNCPNLQSGVRATYASSPPFLAIDLNALDVVLTSIVSPSKSLLRCLTCTLGLNHLLVFWRDSGTLLPDWIRAPS